jgi:hypothetical protein
MVGQHEFWLEIGPDTVIFGTPRTEQHFLLKRFIEINRVFSVLAQRVDFDVAW